MRRAVAILVGALTVLVGAVWSSTAVGSSTDGRGNFLDDDGSVHESAINGMAASDITRGCNPPDNTRYCPNEPVSRAQMATFLVRALGLPATDESGFRDTSGSVHAEAIDALASAGITRGCNPPANDRFCPADSVTRAQMASFLVRALDLRSAEAHGFTDTENSVHRQSIDALAAADITRGCNPPDNTRFCPDQPVTRSQMATFLVRALEGVDPIVNRLSMRSGLRCSKDGLSCTGRVTLAAGVQLQVTEGWYQVLPYRAEEEEAFKAGSTEVSFAWNGSPLERNYLGTSEGSSPATRTWRTNPPTLTSGTHTLRAAWRWAGDVTQSVSYTITVP
ncbi:MAG TPA: S-layer homology domain-containing protein [Acidimicrobiia bacterium]|nr:S-layer homology domain-containing protein [Acidimicrobiia bacterium]